MPFDNDSGRGQSAANHKKAVHGMRIGALAAGLFAAITATANVMAIFSDQPVMGMNGWGLIDAALFAVVAWRVYRLSLPWSIAGLVMFTTERLLAFLHSPHVLSGGLIGTVIFFPAYVNAVRSGLILRKERKADSAPAFPNSASSHVYGDLNQFSTAGDNRPHPSNEEYNEFLAYMKLGQRKFQRPGFTLQDEFAAWLKDRHKHDAAPHAQADKVAG
ncbi:MAG TPA: hypothetical protein VKB38_00980 [Terracidiphilus sp.]|nr:hypothetical protein [Terracidiphilus sp.]